ncbi:hypothetical protein PIB30_073343, partial [Stylosanthes scabra]|nr:hypothetical protein [Stylosanthes scabra]
MATPPDEGQILRMLISVYTGYSLLSTALVLLRDGKNKKRRYKRVEVASIVEKMVESRLGWFDHVRIRLTEHPIRMADEMSSGRSKMTIYKLHPDEGSYVLLLLERWKSPVREIRQIYLISRAQVQLDHNEARDFVRVVGRAALPHPDPVEAHRGQAEGPAPSARKKGLTHTINSLSAPGQNPPHFAEQIHDPLHKDSLDESDGDGRGSACPTPTLKTIGNKLVNPDLHEKK